MKKRALLFSFSLLLASLSPSVFANSELDERNVQSGIVVKISESGNSKTVYHVEDMKEVLSADGSLNADSITKIEASATIVSEVKDSDTPRSELDETSSTGAYWFHPYNGHNWRPIGTSIWYPYTNQSYGHQYWSQSYFYYSQTPYYWRNYYHHNRSGRYASNNWWHCYY
ncbi:MAG: hypothetical protein HQK50_13970 [Oligoflexia bacterium]|nr:hypothetical protein [Oligoflexia bacterium]MBF0366675.1 hypothetical protein [Oligoflexia bacterium]